MATIVTRSGKGSPLTNNEVDANFNNLNSDKIETNAEVRAAVEAATDSNVFTDADHTKLNSVEASADVTDTANVVAALSAGSNITIGNDGTIAGSAPFTLPTAAANTLGGVKIGSGLSIDGSGVVSASGATNLASTTASTNIVITSSTGNNATIAAATTSAAGVMIATDKSKLDGIETSANVTDTANVVAALTAGTNVAIAADGTISATDTNTVYSVGDNGLTQRNFTNTLKSKLDAIEASATADQTNAEIRAAVAAASDSQVFTDADHTKLNGITAGANFINNTNQLTNGAGFITSAVDNTKLPLAGGSITGNVNFTAGDELLVGGTFANNAYNDNTSSTIYLGGGNDRVNYSIGTLMNNVGGNYTKLDLRWHTGIRMFAMPQYGGMRYYTDNTMSTRIFSIGENDSHVRVTNNLIVGGTVDGRDVASDGTKLDGIASGATANASGTSASTASTTVQRDSSGDINVRLVRSEYDSTNSTIGYIMTQIDTASNNYIRPSTPAQVRAGLGFQASTSYLRSDTADTIDNNVVITQRGAFNTGTSGQNNSGVGGDYYYGYQYAGGWSHPYPDLVLGYHTGMRLGGYTGYGGTRFYNDHPNRTTTMLFSVGNGDSHVRANNNIYAYTSDIRLKENFRPIENAVDKVKAIGGFIFDWRKDMMEKHEFTPDQQQDDAGLIAQEVQKVMPAAIKRAPFDHDLTKPNQSKSGEEFLTVQYEKMVPLLVEAIKEQQKQIDELKERLETK